MASVQSKIFTILLRLINKKDLLMRQFKRGKFNTFTTPAPPRGIFKSCVINTHHINGHNVFTLQPKHNCTKKHILYLHGGAYVINFSKLHWYFLKNLIDRTNCSITAPDYPLAPTNTYKETLDMVIKLYQKLLLTVHPDDLILMGDSAGGGLALAMAQKLKIDSIPQPSNIILLSPWLDLTLSNPAITSLDLIDPFTGIEGLRMAGKAYAGGDDLTYFLLSPIHGPLEGLGKISVFVGTKEILVADTRKLKSLLEAQGIHLNYFEYPEMIHVWMLLHFPESKIARSEIAKLITAAIADESI